MKTLAVAKKMNLFKIILAILLLSCLFDFNYGYYQFIKFLGMISFGFLAFINWKKNNLWFVIWLSSCILINPIFKIHLGRDLWNLVDILWAILLIISIILKRKDYN